MPVSDTLRRYRSGQSYTWPNAADVDSQGLQMPPEVAAIISSLVLPPLGQAIGQAAKAAPQRLASEAGAIFPEGGPLPQGGRELMKEFESVLTPSQQNYVRNQNLYDWHASNYDWPRVLSDKWAMLRHSGGS